MVSRCGRISVTHQPRADECQTTDRNVRIRDGILGIFTITASSAMTITFEFDLGSGALMELDSVAKVVAILLNWAPRRHHDANKLMDASETI